MKSNPLTESTFYILLALSTEALHGYAIIKRVEVLSNSRIVLAAGTLYGALENLKKSKLINLVITENDSRRKIYEITNNGRQVLENDYLRIKSLFLIADKILKKGDN